MLVYNTDGSCQRARRISRTYTLCTLYTRYALWVLWRTAIIWPPSIFVRRRMTCARAYDSLCAPCSSDEREIETKSETREERKGKPVKTKKKRTVNERLKAATFAFAYRKSLSIKNENQGRTRSRRSGNDVLSIGTETTPRPFYRLTRRNARMMRSHNLSGRHRTYLIRCITITPTWEPNRERLKRSKKIKTRSFNQRA